MPALAKHKTQHLCISIHTDSELLAGEGKETECLVSELQKIFSIEEEGPYILPRRGEGEELRYLKRKYVFTHEVIKESSYSQTRNMSRN